MTHRQVQSRFDGEVARNRKATWVVMNLSQKEPHLEQKHGNITTVTIYLRIQASCTG